MGVVPERLACRFVETEHLFADVGILESSVGHENAALGDHRTGESPTDRNAPADLQAFGRERFQKSGFSVYTIAVWPSPLRPVIGSQSDSAQETDDHSPGPRDRGKLKIHSIH